jgi:cellulose synthase/poly-beta-1,6-N-acetylglucosamine synthase-like glycosyltransferase
MLKGLRGSRQQHPDDRLPSELPRISLIVPAKNEEKVIGRCLRSLLALDYPRGNMEIIVVVGGSEDATEEVCLRYTKRFPNRIRVLREEASKGKPQALNHALSYVSGEIVGVFDADSVPQRDVLRRVALNFQNAKVMAVQGRTISLNQDENMLTKLASKERTCWTQALIYGREQLDLFIPLTGSCQFVRRGILEEMRGWAEDSLAEDVELSLRMVEKGYLVKYNHEAYSREETPSRLGELIRQRTRWYRGYMEAALKYGRLLNRLSRKAFDAEVFLFGPFMMIICLASYLNWALTLSLLTGTVSPFPTLGVLTVVLTSLTLLSLGASLTLMEKPTRLRNLVWIPFIFTYWFLQILIASWAFLQMTFQRPRVWRRTVKDGVRSPPSPRGRAVLSAS